MALKDCIKKLGVVLSKKDKALLETWIDQGLSDDEVLQRYELHINKTLVDITKRAQEKGAKVSVKRDTLGELRSFSEARTAKIRTRLAEVRAEHGALSNQYGEISFVEGNVKHWEPGGPSIDLNDDGALVMRFHQLRFIHKEMLSEGAFGDGQIKGNDAYELRDSFRAMQERGNKLRDQMYTLFLEEVELVNQLEDQQAGDTGTIDPETGEYRAGPLPPQNVNELKNVYASTAPWSLKTGKDAEGDLYISRHGTAAGTPHKTRQGPNDFAITFDQEVLIPSYAFYLLQYLQPQIAARAHGTAQQAVTKRDIEEVMVNHFRNQAREDTGDFYADSQPAPAQRVEEAVANYKAIVRVEAEREINTGITKVESANDAAHVLAELRRNASEGFWALVLDKDNNVVGVVEHSRGTFDGVSVYPSTYAGAIHTIPGAAKVWMAHNHPSGTPEASQADINITKKIESILNGSDINVEGHFILGSGRDSFTLLDKNGLQLSSDEKITPARRNKRVTVFTRKLRGKQEGEVIRSPAQTEVILARMGNPEGVLLLNNRHKVLGFMSMTAEEMKGLKGTGQGSRLMKAFGETNAAAFIVSLPSVNPDAANNMKAFADAGDWRMLDAIYQDNGVTTSMAAQGTIGGQSEFYQQSNIGFTSGLLTAVQTMSREKGTAAEMLGSLRKIKKNKKGEMVTTYAAGVTKEEMDWLDVEEWAEAKGTLTRQEMIDYVRANGIVIEEVQYADDRAYQGQSLEGGSKRDIILKMPEVPENTLVHKFQIVMDGAFGTDDSITDDQADDVLGWVSSTEQMRGADVGRETVNGASTLSAENITEAQFDLLIAKMNEIGLTAVNEEVTDFRQIDARMQQMVDKVPGLIENYPAPAYFPDRNIIVWMRTTARTGPNGERILMVEEVQSYWHQRGGKFGYRDDNRTEDLVALDTRVKETGKARGVASAAVNEALKRVDYLGFDTLGEARRVIRTVDDWATTWDVQGDEAMIAAGNRYSKSVIEHKLARKDKRNALRRTVDAVPQAPFKGRGWPKLAMKRMIRMAAEEGYDQVSWITGDHANIRNSVGTYVETITYDPATGVLFAIGKPGIIDRTFDLDPSDFDESMGPEVAQRLRDEIQAVEDFYDIVQDPETGMFEIWDGNAEMFRDSSGEIVSADTLAEAEEILAQELNYQDLLPTLTSDDLGVVGEGVTRFQNFYDKEISNLTLAAARKLDKNAKVELEGQEIYLDDGAPYTHELRRAASGDMNLVAWYVVDYHGRQTNGPFTEESMAEGVAGQKNENVTKVHKLVITDQMRAAALEGQTLFQNKKGAISFDQARRGVIKLTESRDLSTFMHEAGHLYLEIMGALAEDDNTPQAVKDDYAKILEYLGVSSRSEITREHHELWAESFEKYLHEGNAPSVALQSAFNAYRRWLTEIWKRIKGDSPDGIVLTPEIRDVMDRILASDDQIAVAKATQNYAAVFQTADQMGVTQREFDVYKGEILKATNEAVEKETIRLMAAANREAKVWWRDERAKVQAEVEAEHYEMQIYKAFSLLAHGTQPNGQPLAQGSPFKIDKESLLELLQGSKDSLKRLPKPWVYTVKGGLDVDVAAKQLGYSEGFDLITALMEMPPMKDAIKVETDERMQVLFPDPLLDGSVSESAIRAVHSDRRAAILATEMRELRRLMKRDKAIVRATKKDAKEQATLARLANKGILPKRDELKIIKQFAKATMGALRIMDVRPEVYLNAERKAGRLAFEAAARGDYQKAYNFKRQQTVNHELYRAAVRAKDQATKSRNYLAKFLKPRVIQRLGKLGVIEPIHAILEGIELKKVTLKEINRRGALQMLAQQIHDGEVVTPISEFLYHIELDKKGNEIVVLNEAPFKNWQELTVDELSAMRDIVKQLEHQAKRKLEMPVNGEMVVLDDAIEELTQQVYEVNDVVEVGIGTKDLGQRVKQAKKSGIAHWLGPSVMARILDKQGWGATTRLIIVNMRRALAEKLIPMQTKALNDVAQIFLKFYAKGTLNWRTKELGKLDKKGFTKINGESMSKSDVLSIALHMGNEGNKSALFNGIRIDGKIAYPEDQVNAALALLDAKDWAFVQSIWDYLDSYWPQLSAMEKERRGISPERVEHVPFTVQTADGQTVNMKGGYMPLSYNYEHSERHEERVFEDHYKNMRNSSYLAASTRAGATHNRVKNHNMVVALGLFQIEKHLKEITRDIAIGDEVNFANNLLNDKGYRKAMKQTGNATSLKELELWLTDAAVGELPANNMVERRMAWVRVGFTVSKLAFNVYTTVLQLTGIMQSMVSLGSGAMAMGAGRVLRNPYTAWTEARDASAFLRARYGWKSQAFDKDIHDAAGVLSEYGPGLPTTRNRVRSSAARMFFLPIAKMQQIVDVITWWGAVWKARNNMGLDENEAVLFADSQVELAQTSGFFSDRSGIERGTLSATTRQQQFIRLWTTLISYMQRKGNIAYFKTQELKENLGVITATKYAIDMLLLFTAEGVASAMLYDRWDWEEDDPEKILLAALKETGASVAAGIPFVREYQSAIYGSGNTPLGGLGNDLVTLYIQALQGEMDPALRKAFVNSMGTLFHLPASQTNRLLEALIDEDDPEILEYFTGTRD